MAVGKLKLPRFTNFAAMIQNQPQLFERYWDEAMTQIEKTLNAILDLPEIKAQLDNLDEATAAAQAAADNANAAADSVASENSLVNSYVSNFVAPLLNATSAGAITIVSHKRVYGNSTLNPTVNVTGNSVASGVAAGSVVRIYYLDPARSGGAVTYLFTVDPAAPKAQGKNVHSVGTVTIPASGSLSGNYIKPPGFVEEPAP